MKTIKNLIKRLLIVGIPLFCFYLLSLYSLAENSKKLHKADAGLGLAIMLGFMLSILVIGLIIDFIYRILKKQYQTALTNVPFLLLFLVPIFYIHCQMGGCCDLFCEWLIDIINIF